MRFEKIKDKKILVLAGGFSDENLVSKRSGSKVFNALKSQGFTDIEYFEINTQKDLTDLTNKLNYVVYDLVYPLTHGKFGEDGCIQGLLELFKVPYIGSNVLSSSICMNKTFTKKILHAHGLSVAQEFFVDDFFDITSDGLYTLDDKKLSNIVFPLIVKPSSEGSSLGLYKINSSKEFKQFILDKPDFITEFTSNKLMVEACINGIEVTTSVINCSQEYFSNLLQLNNFKAGQVYFEDGLLSLSLLRINCSKELLDYEAKYSDGFVSFECPAIMTESQSISLHESVLKAYKACKCNGPARVDFILHNSEEDLTNPNFELKPYILEINTLPGMTDKSDLPAAALASGITYDNLCSLVVLDKLV